MGTFAAYNISGVARKHINENGVYVNHYSLVDYIEKYDGSAWSIDVIAPWILNNISAVSPTEDVTTETYENESWSATSEEELTAALYMVQRNALLSHESDIHIFGPRYNAAGIAYEIGHYKYDTLTQSFTYIDNFLTADFTTGNSYVKSSERTKNGVGYLMGRGGIYHFDVGSNTYIQLSPMLYLDGVGDIGRSGFYGIVDTAVQGYDAQTQIFDNLTLVTGYASAPGNVYQIYDMVYNEVFHRIYPGPSAYPRGVDYTVQQYRFVHYVDMNSLTTTWLNVPVIHWAPHTTDGQTEHTFEGYNMFWWSDRILYTFGVNSIGAGNLNKAFNLLTESMTTLPWRTLSSFSNGHTTVHYGFNTPDRSLLHLLTTTTNDTIHVEWEDTNIHETDTILQIIDSDDPTAVGYSTLVPATDPAGSGDMESYILTSETTGMAIQPDTLYQIQLTPVNTMATLGPRVSGDPVYTLPNTPQLQQNTVAFNSITFTMQDDGNPASTEYAIWENNSQKWINTVGSPATTGEPESTLDHPYWMTREAWNQLGELRGLEAGGVFHVYARNTDHQPSEYQLIEAVKTATVSGQVITANHDPIADCTVRAYLRDTGELLDITTTDAQGNYQLKVWADRECYVVALDPQHGSFSDDLWNLARQDYVIGIPD